MVELPTRGRIDLYKSMRGRLKTCEYERKTHVLPPPPAVNANVLQRLLHETAPVLSIPPRRYHATDNIIVVSQKRNVIVKKFRTIGASPPTRRVRQPNLVRNDHSNTAVCTRCPPSWTGVGGDGLRTELAVRRRRIGWEKYEIETRQVGARELVAPRLLPGLRTARRQQGGQRQHVAWPQRVQRRRLAVRVVHGQPADRR